MANRQDGGPPREAALVINLRSRSGSKAAQNALRELERQGVRIAKSYLAGSGPELLKAVREVIDGGVGTLVIGGGDGTISSGVDLLANRADLTLGLLPVGTGNEVARALGIPLDLEGACRVVAEGHVTTVDLAEANGNFFLHTALVGYAARANHLVPPQLKLHFGKAAYLHSFLAAILGSRPFRATVTAGETRWEMDTILVIVGNRRFHHPAHVLLPETDLPKQGLVVYTPRDARWTTLLRLAVGLWITRRRQPELILATTADSVIIDAEPPQAVDLDGEPVRPTPVSFRIARDALRMLVPRGFQ